MVSWNHNMTFNSIELRFFFLAALCLFGLFTYVPTLGFSPHYKIFFLCQLEVVCSGVYQYLYDIWMFGLPKSNVQYLKFSNKQSRKQYILIRLCILKLKWKIKSVNACITWHIKLPIRMVLTNTFTHEKKN